MRKGIVTALLFLGIVAQPAIAQRAPDQQAPSRKDHGEVEDRSKLADAAVVAAIIAASIAMYKASGRPCACPSDMMKNGAACGNRSAWAKPGGAKPLCFPTDVSADMIKIYRATKAIPPL